MGSRTAGCAGRGPLADGFKAVPWLSEAENSSDANDQCQSSTRPTQSGSPKKATYPGPISQRTPVFRDSLRNASVENEPLACAAHHRQSQASPPTAAGPNNHHALLDPIEVNAFFQYFFLSLFCVHSDVARLRLYMPSTSSPPAAGSSSPPRLFCAASRAAVVMSSPNTRRDSALEQAGSAVRAPMLPDAAHLFAFFSSISVTDTVDFQIGRTRSWVRLRTRDQLATQRNREKNPRRGTEPPRRESHDVATLTCAAIQWADHLGN